MATRTVRREKVIRARRERRQRRVEVARELESFLADRAETVGELQLELAEQEFADLRTTSYTYFAEPAAIKTRAEWERQYAKEYWEWVEAMDEEFEREWDDDICEQIPEVA